MDAADGKGNRDTEAGRGRFHLRTSHLFGFLVLSNLALAFLLNRIVLTDEVYRALLAGQLAVGPLEDRIAMARRWEAWSYLLSPLGLLLRVGLPALLVQLVLLAFGSKPPLGRIFRAGSWAHFSILLGTLVHTAWLATLPPGTIAGGAMATLPGSLAALLPSAWTASPSLALLLGRVTLFDLGWCALFTLALEDGERVPIGVAGASVGIVWLGSTLSWWVALLYLTGLG